MARRPRSRPTRLGDLEAEMLRVLWQLERATVPEVIQRLQWGKPLAYTTVMTVLARLTEKGLLGREKEGRFYAYFPLMPREQIAGSALRGVIDRYFDGLSHRAMAQLLEDDESLDDQELERLERLIRRARKERT